jgi:hypothetical protein
VVNWSDHRKHALSVLKSLNDTRKLPVLRDYVDEEIAVSGGRNNLNCLSAELKWFVDACNVALDRMASISSHHFWPGGFAWQSWIKKLTQIAENHQLPIAARKDTDKAKQGADSPFVVFVHRLQTTPPRLATGVRRLIIRAGRSFPR